MFSPYDSKARRIAFSETWDINISDPVKKPYFYVEVLEKFAKPEKGKEQETITKQIIQIKDLFLTSDSEVFKVIFLILIPSQFQKDRKDYMAKLINNDHIITHTSLGNFLKIRWSFSANKDKLPPLFIQNVTKNDDIEVLKQVNQEIDRLVDFKGAELDLINGPKIMKKFVKKVTPIIILTNFFQEIFS